MSGRRRLVHDRPERPATPCVDPHGLHRMTDRLYRSRDDRMLAGVAGGLADLLDADPSLVRLVWALLVIFTGGIALIVYIVMAIVVPEERRLASAGLSTGGGEARACRRGLPTGSGERERLSSRRLPGHPRWLLPPSGVAPQLDFDWFWPLVLIGLGVLLLILAVGSGDPATQARRGESSPPRVADRGDLADRPGRPLPGPPGGRPVLGGGLADVHHPLGHRRPRLDRSSRGIRRSPASGHSPGPWPGSSWVCSSCSAPPETSEHDPARSSTGGGRWPPLRWGSGSSSVPSSRDEGLPKPLSSPSAARPRPTSASSSVRAS